MDELVRQAVGLVVIAGIALLAFRHSRKSALQRRRRVLEWVGARLGATKLADGLAAVEGAIDGRPARFRFVTHQWAPKYTHVTELECEIPRTKLAFEIRRKIHEGRLVHGTFAGAYTVEGAPEDVLRALLTEPVQEAIVEAGPVRLWIDDNRLCMEWHGWDENHARPIAALETLALVASRIGPAFAEADANVVPEGTPFRGDVAAPLTERAQRREAEVAKLEDLKRGRRLFGRLFRPTHK